MNRLFQMYALVVLLAASSTWAANDSPYQDFKLLNGWRKTPEMHIAGLEIALNKGWITYWRSPGDGGIPPHITFKNSQNVKNIEVIYPAPKMYIKGGMKTLGYEGNVVLPLKITPEALGKDIILSLEVTIGICKDICMPETFLLEGKLKDGRKPSFKLKAALSKVPSTTTNALICDMVPNDKSVEISLGLPNTTEPLPSYIAIESPNPNLWFDDATIEQKDGEIWARTSAHHAAKRPIMLDRSTLRFTLVSESGTQDYLGCRSSN